MVALTERSEFWVFGSPITHSVAPQLHNTVFKALQLPYEFKLCDTKDILEAQTTSLLRSTSFGGAAVTMPLKVSAMSLVDEVDNAAKEIGSINTLTVRSSAATGAPILVGRNFDWVGIFKSFSIALKKEQGIGEFPAGKCGYIIGGGGATRAGVYAFAQLGLSPIFLINRDDKETEGIISQFPQYDLRKLTSLEGWAEWQDKVACGLGAIPSTAPVTDAEKNVYAMAESVFSRHNSSASPRYFLEMCYSPRITPILTMAASKGWITLDGIEPMIEQGLAQDRAWLLDVKSLSAPRLAGGAHLEELGKATEDAVRAQLRGSKIGK